MRDFQAKAFFEENSHGGSTAYARICDHTAHARTCAQGIFGETAQDFLGKWGIFEVNIRDSRVINGIFRVKMRVLGVKFSNRKCLLFGAKSGIFEV